MPQITRDPTMSSCWFRFPTPQWDYDREVKLPLYARHGIAEVWLVGLEAGVVEVFRQPTPEGYEQSSRSERGQNLSVAAVPGLELAVDEVLG